MGGHWSHFWQKMYILNITGLLPETTCLERPNLYGRFDGGGGEGGGGLSRQVLLFPIGSGCELAWPE